MARRRRVGADGELGEVAEPVDRGKPCAALQPRGERLAHELGAGGGGDPAGRVQPRRRGPRRRRGGTPRVRPTRAPWRQTTRASSSTARRAHGSVRRRSGGVLAPGRVGGKDRAWRPGRGARWRRRPRRRRQCRRRPRWPTGAPSRTRWRRPRRCRTRAARRTACGTTAWSPTMLTIGVRARRALCRLARPLPRPGPRCSSVAAGRSAMRAYPSAAPVTDALEQPEDGAHLGHGVERGHEVHLRRARIGEARVDARVGQRADEGLGAVHASNSTPGLRMPFGSNAVLDPAHQLDLHRVLEFEEVLLLGTPDAVLAGDRAAQRHAELEHAAQHLVPLLVVLLEHRHVHVAVARVAAAGDEGVVALGQLGHTRHELRDRGAGDDHVDDVVGAGRLGQPERLLARFDQLRRRGGRAARTRRWRRAR